MFANSGWNDPAGTDAYRRFSYLDAIKGETFTIDGHHFNLTRDLAMQNHYPAVDVLNSISRVMDDIVDEEHKQYARRLKEILSTHRKAEDLINIGAYVSGSNPKIDYAIKMIDQINNYLRQNIAESITFEESLSDLKSLFESSLN